MKVQAFKRCFCRYTEASTITRACVAVHITALAAYCDDLLESPRFEDYAPNGLQVEGARPVRRLVGGVTACLALLEAAVAAQADAVLVHHGLFWKGDSPCLRGMKGRRVATLMRHDMSLLAYHLPLDAHPRLGNNAGLATLLGVGQAASAGTDKGLLWHGELPAPLSLQALATQVEQALGRAVLTVAGGEQAVRRLAWCSGGAQGLIEQAAGLGVDAYLSGEISEPTTHQARELGLHYLAAGHHATERQGVRALGEHLAQRFGLEWRFIDIPNPA